MFGRKGCNQRQPVDEHHQEQTLMPKKYYRVGAGKSRYKNDLKMKNPLHVIIGYRNMRNLSRDDKFVIYGIGMRDI
jgi:hypothetical protein